MICRRLSQSKVTSSEFDAFKVPLLWVKNKKSRVADEKYCTKTLFSCGDFLLLRPFRPIYRKMKKIYSALFGFMVSAIPSLAGGYLTNTNQSVAFLRNPARIGAIGIDGAYSNPAGIGFLSKGWHLSFNIQSAYQTRDIYSTFGTSLKPFALGEGNNPNGEKLFEGLSLIHI